MPKRRNYWDAIEKLNETIDITNPADADLLELAEASRWRTLVQTYHPDGSYTFEPDEPKVKSVQVAEFGFNRIRKAAEFYAETYHGDFEFMIAMRAEMAETGRLTVAQAAGVLNSLIAEAKQRRRRSFGGKKLKRNPERSGFPAKQKEEA